MNSSCGYWFSANVRTLPFHEESVNLFAFCGTRITSWIRWHQVRDYHDWTRERMVACARDTFSVSMIRRRRSLPNGK